MSNPAESGSFFRVSSATRLACGLVRWLRRVWDSTWLVRPRRVWGPGRGSLRLLGSALRVARGGSQWLAGVLRSPWGVRVGSWLSRCRLAVVRGRLATACGGSWGLAGVLRAPCGCSGRLAGCLAATRCGSWGLVMARGDWVVLRGPLGGLGSARGLSCGDSLWLVGARVGSRLSCGCLLGSVLWGLAAGWCLAVLGGSGRLAVTCGDSRWLAAARCGFQGLAVGWGHFATRVVGSLGRLVTACGACGRVEIPGGLLGFCWLLCWLVAIRSW